jgi:ubiquinone/menaquinone biosynthesis C-methylase UbiE
MSKPLGQAGMPRGVLGRLLGRIMAWHNNPDNEWTLSLLNIGSGEKILEVGFGPGKALQSLTKQHPSVHVAGVDHSDTMLQAANTRNRKAVDTGQMSLQLGSVMNLPFEDCGFDKVFSINCIYFWEQPISGITELHRVLKPGGRLAITVRDKQTGAYEPFRPEKLEKMFQQAGFADVKVHTNDVPRHPLFCVLGVK